MYIIHNAYYENSYEMFKGILKMYFKYQITQISHLLQKKYIYIYIQIINVKSILYFEAMFSFSFQLRNNGKNIKKSD